MIIGIFYMLGFSFWGFAPNLTCALPLDPTGDSCPQILVCRCHRISQGDAA